MGGFVVLSFGCAGLYDGITDGEGGEYVSSVDDTLEGVCVCKMAVESMGKELQDSRGGKSGLPAMPDMKRVLADGEMTALDCRGDVGAEGEVSGNGYSNFVESVANGVPTICDDGECREMPERSASSGIAILVDVELGNGTMGSCCGSRL